MKSELSELERLALVVAREQLKRGEPLAPNVARVLVMTVERLSGEYE